MVTLGVHSPMDFGAKGGGADDTGPVQAALDACANGGIFYQPPLTLVTRNLHAHGGTVVQGAGKKSVLQAKPGTTGTFVGLANPASDTAVLMQDIMIDGGNNPGLSNIYYDNTGVHADSLHRFFNVFSCNAGLDAFHMGPAVIETNMISCFAYNSGRYGYNFDVGATDNRVAMCSSGLSAGHGFFVQGNNNHYTDCKAYYAGIIRGTTSWSPGIHGFMLYPAATQDLHMVNLMGCEAQNNSTDGFHVDGSAPGATVQHVSLEGCFADGNNESLGAGSGFYLNNVRYSTVSGAKTRLQNPAAQRYGLRLYGNLTNTFFGANDFTGSAGPTFAHSSAFGYTFQSAAGNVFNSGVVIADQALLSGGMGLDAPFGPAAVRMVNNNDPGNVQFVAPNGDIEFYANGDQRLTVQAAGVHAYAPPNDPGSLANSEVSFWVDETNGLLMFTVRTSTGAVKRGAVALT